MMSGVRGRGNALCLWKDVSVCVYVCVCTRICVWRRERPCATAGAHSLLSDCTCNQAVSAMSATWPRLVPKSKYCTLVLRVLQSTKTCAWIGLSQSDFSRIWHGQHVFTSLSSNNGSMTLTQVIYDKGGLLFLHRAVGIPTFINSLCAVERGWSKTYSHWHVLH